MKALLPIAGALALAGCATAGEDGGIAATCEAEPGQPFVGQRATAEVGAAVQKATGAGTLRWGPPRSAMTMDYRVDRVTVAYDDAMAITRVSCG
jgi:hypothetical protein